MPKFKKQSIKRVVVVNGIAGLDEVEKIAYSRGVKNTCTTSAAYNASQPCKDAMTAWMDATDALEKNQDAKTIKQAELDAILKDEAACVLSYDQTANAFAAAVQVVAKDDAKVVTGMGLGVKSDPTPTSELLVPSGLRITLLKTTGAPRLEWDEVAGATLYTAQMSVDPATETSWVTLYGRGRTRVLPPLVSGQRYVFHVCALGSDSKPTKWSETVSFVAK